MADNKSKPAPQQPNKDIYKGPRPSRTVDQPKPSTITDRVPSPKPTKK